MNPGRGKESGITPARVTAAVLTYVPTDVGYFQDRFDVMRVCIESLIKNTNTPIDLMVFDNASSPRVVDYLTRQYESGNIDYLMLSSRNIGKINALQFLFKSAPGEVIAYCDDDVFHLPGWLERHLEVLDNYPNVGMVTGMYIKTQMKYSIKSTLDFSSQRGVKREEGALVEKDLEQHYIENMGRTWDQYRQEIDGLQDIRLTYQGIQTFVSAGHHQFVGFKDRLLKAMPSQWHSQLMGQMRELDAAIDNLGFLRLSTTPVTVRLLGNRINEKSAQFIRKFDIDVKGVVDDKPMAAWKIKLFRSSPVQKLAYFFYQRLFKIINAGQK